MKESVPPLALVKSPSPAPLARELDGAVLAAAQRGEAAACRALVETYQARVFAVVGRTLGPGRESRVEDVCQDCFLRVFRAIGRFDPAGPAKLSTWILTIATRLCFDEMRRDRVAHEPLADEVDGAPGSDAVAIERALRRRVESALAGLPPDLRATFVLRVTAELSIEETARVLGVDEGTVKSRLSRAREKLRVAVGEV